MRALLHWLLHITGYIYTAAAARFIDFYLFIESMSNTTHTHTTWQVLSSVARLHHSPLAFFYYLILFFYSSAGMMMIIINPSIHPSIQCIYPIIIIIMLLLY